MRRIKKYIKSKPELAISVPAILCFIQFSMNLFEVFKTGIFTSQAMTQLLSSADGFETVVLCVIMVALKDKRK